MTIKRPLKDWPVVKLLTKKIPNIAVEVASGLAEVAMGESPINVVRDRITKSLDKEDSVSVEDKELLLTEIEADLQTADTIARDRASARQAEIERLKVTQGKGFVGKFTYILAICLFAGAFLMLGIITFVEIPKENATLFNVAFGYIWGGFSTVIAFYFGDTDHSKKPDIRVD